MKRRLPPRTKAQRQAALSARMELCTCPECCRLDPSREEIKRLRWTTGRAAENMRAGSQDDEE